MTFVFNSYSIESNIFFFPFLFRQDQTSEIVRAPMVSLLSWKLFEHLMLAITFKCFTPRDLFTRILIITLIILMLSSTHPLDVPHLFSCNFRRCYSYQINSYPIISETSTVSLCSSFLFVYLIIK